MKRDLPIALLICLVGSLTWAFGPFGLGPTWNVNEMDLFPSGGTDINAPVFAILGTQLSTSLDQPSIRSHDVYPEPLDGGIAFKFQIGDGGSFFWSTETNSIWVVQNGPGGDQIQSDIYGNLGPEQGNPHNNRLLWDKEFNLTVADGLFSIGASNSLGWTEFADAVYSYSTDGTAGGDTTYDLVLSGLGSCTIHLPCAAGSTTTAFIEESLSGTCTFPTFSEIGAGFANTANCAVVPQIRTLLIHNVFTVSPP